MSAFSNSLFIGLLGHLIFLVHFFLTISLSPLLQFLASSLFFLCSDSYRCCAGYLPVPFNILLCAARAEDQQTLTSLGFLKSWFSVNLGSRSTRGWSFNWRSRTFSWPPQCRAYSQLPVVAMAAVDRGDSGLQQLQQGSTFPEMPALVSAGSWNCDSLCRNTEAGEA